jgi:hypothetical protein
MAWSGDSGGYITTTVNLPAAAAGQSVQLRWSVGTDSTVADVGQRVDTITLRDASACTLGTPAPVVAFSSAAYSALETDPSAVITATLSPTSTATITATYGTLNGSALAGSDYTAASGTLTFTPGASTATFAVPLLDDALIEGSETLTLTLGGAVSATLGAPNPAILTLLDDDAAGVALSPAASDRAGDAGGVVTHTFTLTNTGTITDTYDVAFTGGTFTATVVSSAGPLAPGASLVLSVVVHVPPGALAGAASASTLTVTSQADAGQSAAAAVTTRVGAFRLYLPLVTR